MQRVTVRSAEVFDRVLRDWASFGQALRRPEAAPAPDWSAPLKLVSAAGELFREQAQRLRELLAQSTHRLSPFADPFTIDFGTHRWLAFDREESYSDWLEWIVGQLASPRAILRLFSVAEDCTDWGACPAIIRREVIVPSGHHGRSGRLDLDIRFADRALIVVEVKKYGADNSDVAKHSGYNRWIHAQCEPFKVSVLLATDGDAEAYEGFRLLTWGQLCINLRRLVPELCSEGKTVAAAMALAFVGAVEQNLLRHSASGIREILGGRAATFDTRIVEHLEISLAAEST